MLLTANSPACGCYLVYFDTDNVPRYVTCYNHRTETLRYVWNRATIDGSGWGAMLAVRRLPCEWARYYSERVQPGYDQLQHYFDNAYSHRGGRWETLTEQQVAELVPQLELPKLD